MHVQDVEAVRVEPGTHTHGGPHTESHSCHRPVDRDGNRASRRGEALGREPEPLQTIPSRVSRSQDMDDVAVAAQPTGQPQNMILHSPGVGEVVGADQTDPQPAVSVQAGGVRNLPGIWTVSRRSGMSAACRLASRGHQALTPGTNGCIMCQSTT